jgi:dTDP-glucose 4,6-dehydratase
VSIITGAGSIGFHVGDFMTRKYLDVRVLWLDVLYSWSIIKNLRPIIGRKTFKFIKRKILDSEIVSRIMPEYQVDTVFYFAAQSHADDPFRNSLKLIQANVLQTHALLKMADLDSIRYAQIAC